MPVRYVVALALAVAVLSIGFVGLEEYAQTSSQQQMEAAVADLSQAAAQLYETEEVPPPGQEGAQRYVTVNLPADSLTSDAISYLRIEQLDGNVSGFEYRLQEGAAYQHRATVPLVVGDGDSMDLRGAGSEHELVLTLEADENGNPVVRVRRATQQFQLTVTTSDGGTVFVNGTEYNEYEDTHEWGTELELVANPDSDERWFDAWGGDVPHRTATETVTVVMSKNRNITATFAQQAIEVDVEPSGDRNEVNRIQVRQNGSLVDEAEAYRDAGFLDIPQRFTDLDPGNYTVQAYAMDMRIDEQTNVSFEPDDTATALLAAPSYVPVEYRVETTDGTPVAGAQVRVRTHEQEQNELWRNRTTGSDGTTTVELQSPRYANASEYFDVAVRYNGTTVGTDQLSAPVAETRTIVINQSSTERRLDTAAGSAGG